MATEDMKLAEGTVIVCSGKDCRRSNGYKKLCAALDGEGSTVVAPVSCLGICEGPAVAITIGDRIEFVAKARGGVRTDLVAVAVNGAAPSSRLRKRMLRRSARSKAVKRLRKRLVLAE